MFDVKKEVPEAPLYRQQFEHDNCGIGACVNIKGTKSRATVENALKIVENLEHRAGKDAEGKTGDGVGILTQVPHTFFKRVTKPLGIQLGGEREYGVGMFFFPQDELKRNQAKKMFEIIVEKEGLEFLGWREVACVPDVLGQRAVECMPCIMQGFVKKPANTPKGIEFDRKLYVARRVFEQSSDNTYVVSLSSRTIVYKGMFLVGQLRTFLRICRARITNQLLQSCIPVFPPTPIPAGKGLIPTVLSSITERLTRSGATMTRCWPVRKIWNPSIFMASFTRCFRRLTPTVPIPPCWITHWNFW